MISSSRVIRANYWVVPTQHRKPILSSEGPNGLCYGHPSDCSRKESYPSGRSRYWSGELPRSGWGQCSRYVRKLYPKLAGVLYFHDTDRIHASRLNINSFVEICEGLAPHSPVVLVVAGKSLLRFDEIKRSVWSKEPCQRVKILSFIGTKDSAEEAVNQIINCTQGSEG